VGRSGRAEPGAGGYRAPPPRVARRGRPRPEDPVCPEPVTTRREDPHDQAGAPFRVAGEPPLGGVSVGPTTGAPLVVLHGGPGESHDALRPHLDALAGPTTRVLYYDQRGAGRSPAPPCGWREHVADLARVCAHLGAAPVAVLGFSWGALLAALFAAERPEAVARVVLVSPGPVDAEGARRVDAALARAARRPAVTAFLEGLAADLRGADLAAAARARTAARIAPAFADPRRALDVATAPVTAAAAEAAWASLRGVDLSARLGAVTAPALVVQGADDPVAAGGGFAALPSARRVTLDACGHAPFVEATDAFLRAVRDFLGEPPPGGA
jgi:proline iminopeptidase